jgi:small subunit ribosomal protein S18
MIDDLDLPTQHLSSGEDIRYLTPIKINDKPIEKYCLFKKYGIKYIDYKNPTFLLKFINKQGKILPRYVTGISLKYQKRMALAIKRARHLAILPFTGDDLK